MAGSWNHMVTDKGKFRGGQLLDNEGDFAEALEECYGMVWYLAEYLTQVTQGFTMEQFIEMARSNYKDGIHHSPGYAKYAREVNRLGRR